MGHASKPGPMAIMVDQRLETELGYSLLEIGQVTFLSEPELAALARALSKLRKQSILLSGPKQLPGIASIQRLARAMGMRAQELEKTEQTPVIAVLFQDSDGTRSERSDHPRRWEDQRQAIKKGFLLADGYELGVPMIPNPKSEAWLLCALKDPPYQHCLQLEGLSGNDDAPNALKKQLAAAMGRPYDNDEMIGYIRTSTVDINRIQDMPSCTAFKDDLRNACNHALRSSKQT
ncbi:MAG: hypothetical protein HQL90_08900 [Magnetococcales bacterium]|nr:hypothetical protein [Magnetococcales bacterium]